MKKLLLFFSICLCLNANLTMAQQIMAQPPESILPSEKTAQQLSELPAEIQRPEIRRAPDGEPGNANKESWIPIGDVNMEIIISIIIAYSCMIFFKPLKKRNI